MKLPKILYTISKALKDNGAKAIVVGGSVRDYFLSLECKDYDVEVYGLNSLEELEEILLEFGKVNLVGKSFGILKFSYQNQEYDFSFPRIERKISVGHKGFDVEIDGSLEYKEASIRRDFTINAIGYDIEAYKFLDPYGGLDDIKSKILRHINSKTFVEDPLRVYRAMQFSARFEYKLAQQTFKLCKEMVKKRMLDELPKERVYEEFKKLLLKSKKPSIGFELMRELGILERYFSELYAIIDVPQSPKWHPEGDVWVHTMMSLDAMAKELSAKDIDSKQKLKYMFAILCHDLGKAKTTTIEEDGTIRSIGHEKAGVEPTKSFLQKLTNEQDLIESILPLVEHHLKPSQFFSAKSKASAIRRLATKVNIEELVVVAKADFLGRTTKEALSGKYEAGEWLLKRAEELNVKNKPIKPLIQGRDLIALGLKPSPKFKEILNELYIMQLDGKFNTKDEAIEYIKAKYE